MPFCESCQRGNSSVLQHAHWWKASTLACAASAQQLSCNWQNLSPGVTLSCGGTAVRGLPRTHNGLALRRIIHVLMLAHTLYPCKAAMCT